MQTPGPKNMKRIGGAHILGEQAQKCKAQYHPEGVCVDATGMWEESSCAIPGEICLFVRED